MDTNVENWEKDKFYEPANLNCKAEIEAYKTTLNEMAYICTSGT